MWTKVFGGSLRDGAFVNTNIVNTQDGGFVTAAFAFSTDGDISGQHGFEDFWIIKVDALGSKVWSRVLGGSGDDLPYSILATNDGGFLIAGLTSSTDGNVTTSKGNGDAWIIKLDASGNLIWQKSYGGTAYDEAAYIVPTKDGNYLVAGTTYSSSGDVSLNHGDKDVWLFKIDGSGNLLWSKTYGGSGGDIALGITSITSGGYVICANTTSIDGDITNSKGYVDAWLLKVDENGNKMWSTIIGGSNYDGPESITSDVQGSVYITGRTNSSNGDIPQNLGDYDLFVAKLDSSGNKQWLKTFGGSAADEGFSIVMTADKNLLACGRTVSSDKDVTHNNGGYDGWLVKLDLSGNKIWETNFGGTANEEIDAVISLANGNYVIAGSTASNDIDITGNHGDFDLFLMEFKE